MFLLDTDTISLMQFGHPVVLKRAASHPETSLFISSISVQEQMKGWTAHAAQTRTPLPPPMSRSHRAANARDGSSGNRDHQ